MTFSFTFECDECGAKGNTRQFDLWVPGTLDKFTQEFHAEIRRIHQSKTPGCRGTLNTKMTKHYETGRRLRFA